MLKALTEQFRLKDTNQNGNIRIHYEEVTRQFVSWYDLRLIVEG